MKDNKLQGICRECSHRYHCVDATRHLNMLNCTRFKQKIHRDKLRIEGIENE